MKIPCYIITLDPQKKSSIKLLEALRQQGIEAEFFPAVDGRKKMPELMDGEELDPSLSMKRRLAVLHTSEIGCYLSHFRLIKSAYASGAQKVCIFEDDIELESDLGLTLREIGCLDDEYEFVRLMSLRMRKRKVVRELSCGRWLTRPVRGLKGTQGYVINRRGMEKVIRHGRVLSLPIDIFYDRFWETDLKCYGIEPHVIFTNNSESSVKKPKETRSACSLSEIWGWRVEKMRKSIQYMMYILRFWQDFYPSRLPEYKLGQTIRIK